MRLPLRKKGSILWPNTRTTTSRPREQLVAGFRKEHTVGNGAFHRSAIVVSNESRAASASGRHSNW